MRMSGSPPITYWPIFSVAQTQQKWQNESFRDVAVIGGLIFQGYPGEQKKARHLQSSASLLFNVFSEYEPGNLLLRQSYQEVFDQQMEEVRLRNMLERVQRSKIIITFPQQLTPFCFPIKVDSMRENLTSEKTRGPREKNAAAIERLTGN